MEAIWPLVTVLGPILLITVMIWAWRRNRSAGRASFERAERGARELRAEIEEDEARRGAP